MHYASDEPPRSLNDPTSKQRTQPCWSVMMLGFVLLLPSGHALSSLSMVSGGPRTATRGASLSTPSQSTTNPIRIDYPVTRTPPSSLSYYDDDDEDEDEDLLFFDQDSLDSFIRLQESTGSEILQSDLQAQIDEARNFPDLFVDNQDASLIEKIAMSSVTEQLPQRAVQALAAQQQQAIKKLKNKNKNAKTGSLNRGGPRLSHEQEIVLARTIQKGAALQKLRKQLQLELCRMPTKQEWAVRAELSTASLRRRISDYRIAKHHLVTANLGLVHAVVNQLHNSYSTSTVTKEELVQEGSLGLMRAAELFDPSRGLRFSTYAVVWIKGTLSNSHLPELVKLPSREKTRWNKIVNAQRDLQQEQQASYQVGQEQTPVQLETVAKHIGLTVEQVLATQRRMAQAQRVLSLDYAAETQSRSGTESGLMSNMLEKDKSLQADVDLAERTQLQADVIAAMARNLDAREARLMRLRYGLSDGHARSLTECAEAMGLSYTRVHQLATRCLKKLRQAAEVEALDEYLLTVA